MTPRLWQTLFLNRSQTFLPSHSLHCHWNSGEAVGSSCSFAETLNFHRLLNRRQDLMHRGKAKKILAFQEISSSSSSSSDLIHTGKAKMFAFRAFSSPSSPSGLLYNGNEKHFAIRAISWISSSSSSNLTCHRIERPSAFRTFPSPSLGSIYNGMDRRYALRASPSPSLCSIYYGKYEPSAFRPFLSSCSGSVYPRKDASSALRPFSTSSSSDQDSVPEWIEEVVQLSEQGEVLDSYKGYREAMPGLDDFVYVGEKKKKALTDEQIVENICNIIRRWGWGSHAENELENMTFRPTSYHIIEVLKQFRDLDILMGFFRWSRGQKWYSPSISIFNLLIDRTGLNRDFEGVLWLQNTMKEDNCPPTSVTLNILIKCYLRASKLEEALSCFAENTKSKDLQPDMMTFNTLIGSCVDGGLHQKAIEIFNTMEEFGSVPEKHVYETMIPVFVKAGNLEKAGKLFEEMRSKGNQGSLSLYACLIDSLGRAGRLDFAMKLFSEIKDFGKTPSAGMHVSLIESFAKAGKLEMALKILGLMQKAEHIPTSSVFTCLIDAHLKARQLDKAMQLLGNMMKIGHLPSRALYSSFIDAHLKARELNTAIKLFASMQDAGVLPTPPVCTSLVHSSALTGDLQTTMKLFQSMHKLGFRHGEGTYALVLPLLMKQSPQDHLMSFMQEMKANHYPVDGLASNALMGILLDGHTIPACECYKVFMSMSVEINSRVSRHIMEASLKDGLYDVANMAVERLMKSGFRADLRMYTLILSCFSRCEVMDKEALIMSMLSSTNHSAHKFVCGLLTSPEQRNDSALNFVRSYFESLEHEVDEKLARWFACVLLNYLVLMGQIKRARCVWKVAYEKKLFPNRILFDQELVWSLDVRALSIGAALTAIVHTLHRFRKRMIHYHTIPRRIKIVTGSTLNDPIQDLLRPLDSPFENHGGALRCRGAYVAQWFNKPIVEKFLENELPSREELVMQKINMLFPRPKPEPYMLIVNSATSF